ncbi:MAG: hypothetical protein KGR16_06495 [Verrucomicrobia bacterium]|nr:hypothetical protein [Verrucomicrobiota bacterium]MDE3047061.1 hypothetical protein [Verrucomicrobiota bacterium]
MRKETTTLLHFHPEKIGWIGLMLLGLGLLVALPFLWTMQNVESPRLREKREHPAPLAPYTFTLPLSPSTPGFCIPDLQGKMTFSFDPPRPDCLTAPNRLLVRLKQSGESQRVVLPCRIDLEYQRDQLKFAQPPSEFWMELAALPSGQILATGWISSLDGTKVSAGQFQVSGQECPLQEAHEFPEGSPFRQLAEAKWWGRDLFRGANALAERIETQELLELKETDWLVWQEGKWQKQEKPHPELPIAHIQSISPKTLVLEGWDANAHTRIALPLASGPPFKMKAEELLSSLRIRSEKQISCMLEKQCLVLKTGDWVLKTGGRWKVLRKKEEREAFFNGKLFGELFILDQISQKQGQKMIQGRLFNSGRTQFIAIDMAVQGHKTARKPP